MEHDDHFLVYTLGSDWTLGEPDKPHMQALVVAEDIGNQLFVQAIGFAQLAFGAVTVDSMAKAALGHTDEHLYLWPAFTRHDAENGTQREDGDGATACREERLDVFLQTEVLTLRETIHFHTLNILWMEYVLGKFMKSKRGQQVAAHRRLHTTC